MINIFGRWKGVCVYGPEFEEDEGKELFFSLDIQQDNDEFKGIAYDVEGFGMTPGKATVKGFIDKNTLSFVKQYESSFEFDDEGNEIFVEGKPSPEIFYTCTYDKSDLSIEGDWEMGVNPFEVTDGVLEYVLRGTFSMTRV